MQPDNPIVGGTILRRPAIASPDFVSGSTGWSINVDGSVEFNNAIVRGSEVIGNSGTAHIVIADSSQIPAELQTFYAGNGGVGAAILFYGPSTSYGYIATVINTSAVCYGSVTSAGVVSEQFRLLDPSVTPASLQYSLLSGQHITYSAGSDIALLAGTQTGVATGFKSEVGLKAAISGNVETWHAMSLLNSWTNFGGAFVTAQYRLVCAPADEVEIIGMIAPGTKTDGTNVASLPAAYRPARTQRLPMEQGGIAGAANPTIQLDSSGNLQIFGVNQAGLSYVTFHQLFSLDA